jgi:hypothetical protein
VAVHRRRRRAGRADPQPPEHSRCSRARRARGDGRRPGRIRRASTPTIPRRSIVGTGTEVAVAVEAAESLAADGVRPGGVAAELGAVRGQDEEYRDAVLPPDVPTVSVEAGVTSGWDRWARGRSASTASGPRRPGRWCWPSSASRRRVAGPGALTALNAPGSPTAADPARLGSRHGQLHDLFTSRARAPGSTTSSAGGSLGRDRPVGRSRGARHHLEPVDLPEGDRVGRRVHPPARRAGRAGAPSRTATGSSSSATSRTPSRSCGRCTRSPGALDGHVSVEVSPGPRSRHRRPPSSRRHLWDRIDRRTCGEDPRHGRGPPGDPHDDRRGSQHQRDADLQPRALRAR